MKNVLVVANETLGGAKLLERVRARDAEGEVNWFLVVPRGRPGHGAVVYEEAVHDAAQIRVDLAQLLLGEEGLSFRGEVGDSDPFTATMDAIAEHAIDEVIVSTYPATSSGWLRRDLIERIAHASGLPVEHVVIDVEAQGLPFSVVLVVANQTAERVELLSRLREKAAEADRQLFILVEPQEGGYGAHAAQARKRLARTLAFFKSEGLLAAGMIGDPDPYDATMNALQVFRVSEIIISTLAETKSGWLRADLVERVRRSSGRPVEHIVAHEPAAARS